MGNDDKPVLRLNELDSTFISYGAPDEPFARRLYRALQHNGVRTFFFPESAVPGDKLHRTMRKGVNDHDRVILVCSRASLDREGVLNEIEETLAREAREGGSALLIPVTLDDYVFQDWSPPKPDAAQSVRDRVVADFRGTDNDEGKFDEAISRLLEALKKTTSDNEGQSALHGIERRRPRKLRARRPALLSLALGLPSVLALAYLRFQRHTEVGPPVHVDERERKPVDAAQPSVLGVTPIESLPKEQQANLQGIFGHYGGTFQALDENNNPRPQDFGLTIERTGSGDFPGRSFVTAKFSAGDMSFSVMCQISVLPIYFTGGYTFLLWSVPKVVPTVDQTDPINIRIEVSVDSSGRFDLTQAIVFGIVDVVTEQNVVKFNAIHRGG